MPKIPDFSKLDFQGIVNSLKSVLSSEPTTPTVTPGDPVGEKIVEISTLIKNVVKEQTQCAKDLSRINDLLNNLYQDVEKFRKGSQETVKPIHEKETSSTTQSTSKAQPTSSEPPVTPTPSSETSTKRTTEEEIKKKSEDV
jgi:hypothetical protein